MHSEYDVLANNDAERTSRMKQLLKTILPAHLLHAALNVRDRLRLAAVPRRPFDAAPLRRAGDIGLDALFSARGADIAWHADHSDIKRVFGHDDLFGGINPGDRRALYLLIRGLKPEAVLEVGTHIGASTLHIARALQANGGGHVTTVDIVDVNSPRGPWKSVGLPCPPRELAERLGCAQHIAFTDSGSLPFMQDTAARFDFIFLDGDHAPQTVYKEIAAALSVLKPSGTILLHDYYPNAQPLFPDRNIIQGPFRALARIAAENPEIKVLPLGNLPWPTKQGTRATSLALLSRNNEARAY
jgi:predicted O-methyltransferase YrrM